MTLLDQESLLTESDDRTMQLTTHRIRHEYDGREGKAFTSIFLENVSSITVTRINKTMLLILGILAALGGASLLSSREQGVGMVLLAAGIILIVVYFTSRKQVIRVASNGGDAITLVIEGMGDVMVRSFVDKIEKAKNDRVRSLNPA